MGRNDMRHFMKIAIGLLLAASMSAASAATICTPIAPKEWKGHLQSVHQGASVATTFFENNGCNWQGFDQMNGTDGLVLDMEGQEGTGNVSATTGPTASFLVVVQGYFLDANCKKIDGSDWHVTASPSTSATADLLTIPTGAKWMLLTSTDANAGNDFDVTVHSDGKDCPKVIKKKKKKK
jgi:hypothetical protein